MRVYYFTDATYAISNLSFRRLKISRFGQLNDPFELLAADLLDPRHRKAITALKSQLDATQGLVCFSGTWGTPLLWGHYANKHSGMALGFDIPDHFLSKIIYTSQRANVTFDTTAKKIVDGLNVVDKLIRTKFTDWKYEDEYRLFIELDPTTVEAGNYFVDFSDNIKLMEVILGMNCALPIRRVRQLLETDLTHVRVKKAGMALRSFKVIEDRSFRE